MMTLHVGLRVADLERSLAFYTGLGYVVVGNVPETEFGSLTMLKLPGDEFVTLELVHDPCRDVVEPGGLNQVVVQVESMQATVAKLAARGIEVETPALARRIRRFLDGVDHRPRRLPDRIGAVARRPPPGDDRGGLRRSGRSRVTTA
jgi:lactoylglutathione lyase